MGGPVRLARLLDDACDRHPGKLAIASRDDRLSFEQLRERAARLATAFADANLAGERVATLLPNGPELIVCYLACWAAGVIMVPFEYVDARPRSATASPTAAPAGSSCTRKSSTTWPASGSRTPASGAWPSSALRASPSSPSPHCWRRHRERSRTWPAAASGPASTPPGPPHPH